MAGSANAAPARLGNGSVPARIAVFSQPGGRTRRGGSGTVAGVNIDFDDGDAGFWEARMLYAMATHYVVKLPQDGDEALLDFLKDAALSHMSRPEYARLREEVGVSEPEWPTWSLLNNFWRRTLGPSRREEDLSEQRSAALERADRAERSAFEALAEAARAGRDRDQCKVEVERLRREIARFEEVRSSAGQREPDA